MKMDTTLAPSRPAAAELERSAPTARRLAEASIQPEYPPGPTPGRSAASTLGSTVRPLEDATLAAYLGELHD